MKKLLLGAFLLVSALSFSATRKVPAERIIMDQTTGIAYVQGEQTPFTGEIEVKFDNGQVQAWMEIKDGLLDGIVKKYDENGEVAQQGLFKDGVQIQ